jgi:hypothetical protein
MDLQDKMERAKIDLKQHFYRFDLRDQLIREHEAFEEIEHQVKEFFNKIGQLQPAEVMQNESLRSELGGIKEFVNKRQLPISYFDERWELTSLFDELQKYQINLQKKEEDRLRREDLDRKERERKEREERQRREDLERRERERKEREERQRQEDLERRERERRELEERQRREDLERRERERRELEERQRREDLERREQKEERERKQSEESEKLERERNAQQEPVSKNTPPPKDKPVEDQEQSHRPIKSQVEMTSFRRSLNSSKEQGQLTDATDKKPNGFEQLLKNYIRERDQKAWTYHMLSLFQYTKKDKIDAATLFIDALKSPCVMISRQVGETLKNGSLGSRIETYIKEHGEDLKQELNTSEDFESIDQVIDFLNRRDPIQAFVGALKQYRDQRSNDVRNMYHFAIFPQFTKQDKLTAVDKLISTLETKSNQLSDYDQSALAQGSLGESIEGFIKQYNQELADNLQVDEINNLGQLVRARINPAQLVSELN